MALGTGAISLTEIVAEIAGGQTSLQECFNEANGTFNSTYAIGGVQAMSEFRGYSDFTETISISPTSAQVGAGGGTRNFSVTSNTTWTISSIGTWISVSGASGNGNDTFVTATFTSNGTGGTRFGTISAVTSGGGASAQLTIIQTST